MQKEVVFGIPTGVMLLILTALCVYWAVLAHRKWKADQSYGWLFLTVFWTICAFAVFGSVFVIPPFIVLFSV